MATFRRGSTNLAAGINSSPRVQKQTNIAHAIPQFVGAMRGIDPGAGDMTSAFNSFFGQINNAVQQTVGTYNDLEKQRIRKENDMLKKMAFNDAQRVANAGLNKTSGELLAQMPNSVMVENATGQMEALDVTKRASYTQTFSHALGVLNGERLVNQFHLDRQSQNIAPENYDAYAQAYWTQKFQDGTGNAYHDAAMYAMWERQAGKARYENQQKVISRAHARTDTAINKVIYNRGENIDSINHVGLAASVQDYLDSPQGRNKTIGEAKSAVIGLWLTAAKKKKSTALALNRFLYEEHVDNDGNVSPSLMSLFPNEMKVHEENLRKHYREHATILGDEVMVRQTTRAAEIGAMPETTVAQRNQKLANLVQLRQAARKLDDTAGVSAQSRATHKALLDKKIRELSAKQVSMNQMRAAMGIGPAGQANPNYKPRFTPEVQKQVVADMIEEMNFIADPDKTAMFASGFATYHKKYQDIPDGVVDLISQGLTSNDPAVIANTWKVVSTLDPRGTLLNKKFGDNPKALLAYQKIQASQGQAPSVDFNSPNYQAAAEQYATPADLLSKGLGVDTSDVKNNEMEDRLKEELFGYTFGTGDNLAEMTIDKDAWFFQNDYRFSPEAQRVALGIAREVAIQHFADTGDHIGKDKLRKMVATRMRPLVVPGGDNLLSLETAAAPAANDKRPIENRANLVYEEVNAEGRVENPLETMRQDIEAVGNAMLNLTRDDGTKVESGDLTVNVNNVVPGTNLRYVMDNAHSNGRMPFTMGIGEEFRVASTHSASGDELGFFDKINLREKALKEGKDFYEAVALEQKFKFTGNIQKDEILAEKYLPPFLTLVPRKSADGTIIGYNLAIGPRHTNFSDDYITLAQIRRRISGGRPLPEGLKKHLRQQDQYNIFETIRQESEYGVYD